MSDDVLDWLKSERDRHATARDEFFKTDNWASGNLHDDQSKNLYRAIDEIERLRVVVSVMKDVLMNRIVEGYKL